MTQHDIKEAKITEKPRTRIRKSVATSKLKLKLIYSCLPCVTNAIISGGIKVRIMTKNWKRVALLQM